jgi:hypothetical protein
MHYSTYTLYPKKLTGPSPLILPKTKEGEKQKKKYQTLSKKTPPNALKLPSYNNLLRVSFKSLAAEDRSRTNAVARTFSIGSRKHASQHPEGRFSIHSSFSVKARNNIVPFLFVK